MTEKKRTTFPRPVIHEDGTMTVNGTDLNELGAFILLHPEICDDLLAFAISLLEKKGACPSDLK